MRPAGAPDVDGELAERIARLESLGYRRIGETLTRTPTGDGFAWALASAEEETYVLLAKGAGAAMPGLTGFYTTWPDAEWLGTMHPFGRPYRARALQIRIVRHTFGEAEASHRAAVNERRARHGPPRRITSLGDVLALDAEYRTRFGGRELRLKFFESMLPIAVAAVGVVLCLVDLVAR